MRAGTWSKAPSVRAGGSPKKKKATIFGIFLFPLITIMLIQSAITIGTLVLRRTTETLEAYAGGMMGRLVENRGVILENDMTQRWSSICEEEALITDLLEQFLEHEDITLEELLLSEERRTQLLRHFFPECLDILHSNLTTGIFLVLTSPNQGAAGEYDGFFIRDSDPYTNPVNYTDLLLERGDKHLSRTWNIPLDTNWTTRFHMDGQGVSTADHYFYEPWRAGAAYPDADVKDLGYWALPFSLEKNTADPHEMISYSLPLRYQGHVYGVLGVEISTSLLYDYFPISELNESQQSGYMLAIRGKDDGYTPLTGKGLLYNLVCSEGSRFFLKETNYDNLSLVQDVKLNEQGIYAVACPLNLYSNHVPYADTEWLLLGLDTETDLFGMSRQLYVWMVIAVMIGLVFGVFGIYFVVRHLTRPVQHLMRCISQGRAGLQTFKPSNILEIDALYDVVNRLTERQKEAENILLEEKERYKMALESSQDVFFSYDLQRRQLDVVNHKTINGQRQTAEKDIINPEYIYEADRSEVMQVMLQTPDQPYVEFRIRWPGETEFSWVALSGKVIYDTDGQRWKLVGSIHNIQEQKELEAQQLRRSTVDGVTGFYGANAGIKKLRDYRQNQPEGVMVLLHLKHLKAASEKNGIVFADMILEEFGAIIRADCRTFAEQTDCRTAALRLNRNELVLWLEGASRSQAEALAGTLLHDMEAAFPEEQFGLLLSAGLARGDQTLSAEVLIQRADLAQRQSSGGALFYEDLAKQEPLPALREQEINSLGYGEDVSLVSVALNLFGKGADFPGQMTLMIRKIGRSYQAEGVLVSLLRPDFNSNYLNYQWHSSGPDMEDCVRKYREEDKADFFTWLDQAEVRYFSQEDSQQDVIQRFLSVSPGQRGILLPMYDSGNYIGNICILGLGPERLESPETYQDLAELSQVIQSQLNQQQHDLASKAKSEFLSRMSHEIRTPMNGIIGMTAIALQRDQTPERITDCLQKIQSSSDYLLGLINDILDMSKIESGKMKLEPFDFYIDKTLDTIRELIAGQAAAKQVEFVQDIRLKHHWFFADSMRISQVLINLLGNAVKFTPEGGRVTLTVREEGAAETGSLLFFSVKDTGIGIPKEEQERVFRSFEQASGTSPSKYRGTGLGLSISNRLVQMMGSSIQLDSTPGQGSTFSFSIPLTLGQSQEPEADQAVVSFAGRRILVVEDNELNAEIAQCLLEERDFEVDCVGDGAQAVERIRSTPPGTYDVILMDIMMPVMDGLDATRAIRAMEREDCRTIPIIAMSANAFDDDLKKSVECGMNGHLSKPVEVEKLYQTLNEVVLKRH